MMTHCEIGDILIHPLIIIYEFILDFPSNMNISADWRFSAIAFRMSYRDILLQGGKVMPHFLRFSSIHIWNQLITLLYVKNISGMVLVSYLPTSAVCMNVRMY